MCAVIGYQLLNQSHVPEVMDFIEQLLLQSQIRGKHATGMAYASAGVIICYKQPVPATEFVQSVEWQAFKKVHPVSAILHCRYSTSGDWQDNANNQPLTSQELALVHNGLVSQATKEEFCAQYKVRTTSANDSEIILRKVLRAKHRLEDNSLTDEGIGSTTTAIAEALESIHKVDPPIFALGFLDSTGQVYAVRDHIRPLWFFYIKAWGIVGFASTQDIIKRALRKVGRSATDAGVAVWPAEPYRVYPVGPTINRDSQSLCFAYPQEERFTRPNLVHSQWLQNRRAKDIGPGLALDNWKTRDHRTDMREAFKLYSIAAIASWEIDPNYPMLNYLFRRYELSKSQEYWACWLYGVFYHPGTLFRFMQEFPEFEKVDLGRLERWHADNWRTLDYNTDRKYEKGHLVEMFISYRDLVGGQHPDSQESFFSALLGDDPVVNFHTVFKALKGLLRFGRYATYIYTEALARCMGMPIQADTVFLKEASSPRAGLCYATNRPDWAKATLSKEQWKELHDDLDSIMTELQEEYPDVPTDHWLMESCLCAFKGFLRPTKGRYLGFYQDRMAHEILQGQTRPETSGVDWRVLWQFRRECLMWEYLGELKNPAIMKVDREKEFVFKQSGHMIGLWPIVKRGIINGAQVY